MLAGDDYDKSPFMCIEPVFVSISAYESSTVHPIAVNSCGMARLKIRPKTVKSDEFL